VWEALWGTVGMGLAPKPRVPGQGSSLGRASMAAWCTWGPGSTLVSFCFLKALKNLKM